MLPFIFENFSLPQCRSQLEDVLERFFTAWKAARGTMTPPSCLFLCLSEVQPIL